MEYIALCDSYGFAGGYVKEGETVTITDKQKKEYDSKYFEALFAPIGGVEEPAPAEVNDAPVEEPAPAEVNDAPVEEPAPAEVNDAPVEEPTVSE